MNAAPFVNEAYSDFNDPKLAAKMQAALTAVRAQFGREYDLLIAGERRRQDEKLESFNPAKPSERVGLHQKGTIQDAKDAVEAAHAFFPEWSDCSMEERAGLLFQVAEILRRRKYEFNAWLIFESGKNWNEAEADVSEAIDFCEYYARQALKLAQTPELVQLPGERDELVYLPLGAGVIIPPWNFPLAILVGMTVAALVTGNTVVIKPSSETPTIAAKFVEVLQEAGFPPRSFSFLTGSGGAIGDTLVAHHRTRFVSFTGSREVGLHINRLAADTAEAQIWIKRVVAEMGGKDAIVVDSDTDLEQAVTGVLVSAFGFQGQKCSACSRAIVHEAIYDGFLAALKAKAEQLHLGAPEDRQNYMGPVISERAKATILDYIESGKSEARLVTGGAPLEQEGHFLPPTIFADVQPTARIFREEIFGPVLSVSKVSTFEQGIAYANESEYGLTGAVYTRDPEKIAYAKRRFFVGNLYVNRKCTGAMVGAHPFGGFNMSGTDSKAGGPDYLLQFVQGKSIAEKIS